MEDEEFEKVFMKLVDKFEDYSYFLSIGAFNYKDTKHEIKQILEEIESNAFKRGKRSALIHPSSSYLDVDEYYPENKEAKP
jgi:hypothetical protein